MAADLQRLRLASQGLARATFAGPEDVVAWFGAVQAQDYLGSLWGIGQRTRRATEADVEAAESRRAIVRTWPMRGTLHFVAAEDLRWMLDLLAPRVIARHRKRLENAFGVDAKTLRRATALLERELHGGRAMTRSEVYSLLDKAKIATQNSRGLHILFALAHEQLLCFGARRGKQPTFVLLDEWVPRAKSAPSDPLLTLAQRYVASHGPATSDDFAWWSGVAPKEAREAFANIEQPRDARVKRGLVHLLPPFDEYAVAYRDRTSILDPAFNKRLNGGGGLLNAIVVIDGIVQGTWKRTLAKDSVAVTVSRFREFTAREERALQREVERYAAFVGASYSSLS